MWRRFAPGASHLSLVEQAPCPPSVPASPFRASHMREFATAPIRQDRHVKADGWSLFSTLVNLWPYIWPSDRADLKARVLFATVLIFVAKLATIAVPFTFKWATDALAGHGTAPIGANDW